MNHIKCDVRTSLQNVNGRHKHHTYAMITTVLGTNISFDNDS